MKKIFKKNQIIISILAVMIAAAGYINYTGFEFGDNEDTALNDDSSVETVNDIETDISQEDIENTEAEISADDEKASASQEESPGSAVLASSSSSTELIAEVKLSREQVRAKNKDTLLEVINNTEVADELKQDAIADMVEMTDIAEKEMQAEILLDAKGFADSVVTITEQSADVVINKTKITKEESAQIEDIVVRKTEVPAENVVITTVKE